MTRSAKPKPPSVKTREQVQAEFSEAGINVSEWSRAHGFSRGVVVGVLTGHLAGNYGEAHRVAVALGMKVGKVVDVKSFKPLTKAAA